MSRMSKLMLVGPIMDGFPWPLGTSVLDGAGGQTGCHVPLREDEQDRGRDGGQHRGRHELAPLLVLGPDVVVEAHGDRTETSAVAIECGGEQEVRPCPQEGEETDSD